MNLHLHSVDKPTQVQSTVGIYFTDRPRQQFPILLQLEHDSALDIPAGYRDFVVTDDFRLPMAIEMRRYGRWSRWPRRVPMIP